MALPVLFSGVADFRGELAALSAALIWAIASIVYTQIGRRISPLLLNLAKGLIAIVLLLLTLLLIGGLTPPVSPTATGLLLVSGAIGIGFGDTAYFQALNDLGARRSLVLESLAPPFAALLAWLFLREQLAIAAWWGIALTIFGVVWVIVERAPNPTDAPRHAFRGISCGLLAALAQASGVVLSRSVLADSSIDPLWSTLMRLVAGVLVLLVWLLFQQPSLQQLTALRDRALLTRLLATAFASAYLAIWLQQISLKYAPAGIAQALSATSPVFMIPLALWMGEKVSPRAILGVFVALAGVWLLFDRF